VLGPICQGFKREFFHEGIAFFEEETKKVMLPGHVFLLQKLFLLIFVKSVRWHRWVHLFRFMHTQ
jgi:hypothetical protein